MNDTPSHSSRFGAFLSGAMSGAFNSALMLGIYQLVSAVIPALHIIPWIAVGATLLTTSLFSGIMAVKRAMSESHGESHAVRDARQAVVVPVIAQSMQPQLEVAVDEQPERSTSWAERTGRRNAAEARAEILDRGPAADRDRASEILAQRDNANGASASL